MKTCPRTALATVVLAIAGLAAAHAQAKARASVSTGGFEYQVLCDRCGKRGDCLSVKAVAPGARAAKLVVEEESSCRGVPERLEVKLSAGEFKLSPKLTGVLIKQEAGGEAIAQDCGLVALGDGKLARLWDAMYSGREFVPIKGYTLTTVDSDGNGRQEIDYKAPFPVSNDAGGAEQMIRVNEAAADTWQHQRLEFDDAKKAMAEKLPHEEFAA